MAKNILDQSIKGYDNVADLIKHEVNEFCKNDKDFEEITSKIVASKNIDEYKGNLDLVHMLCNLSIIDKIKKLINITEKDQQDIIKACSDEFFKNITKLIEPTRTNSVLTLLGTSLLSSIAGMVGTAGMVGFNNIGMLKTTRRDTFEADSDDVKGIENVDADRLTTSEYKDILRLAGKNIPALGLLSFIGTKDEVNKSLFDDDENDLQ